MFYEVFFLGIALFGAILGTYTDIKTREVPNWINYFIIMIGLIGHLIVSIAIKLIWPILFSIAGAIIFYTVGAIMFYSGQWGGGDAKLITGFGALLPLYPTILNKIFNPYIAPWPFILTLWINILVFGAAFSILAIIYLAIKNRNKISNDIKKFLNKYKIIRYIILILLIIIITTKFLIENIIINLILFLWALMALLYYILIIAKAVEKNCFFKKIKPSQLTEGDWITTDIKIGKKLIYSPNKTGIKIKDIMKLIKLERKKKLKSVEIKEGLPFVPAFLAGLVFSIIFGDIMFRLLFYLL